jgi:hypothetical protein
LSLFLHAAGHVVFIAAFNILFSKGKHSALSEHAINGGYFMNTVIDGLMLELEQQLEEKVAEDLRDLLDEYKP